MKRLIQAVLALGVALARTAANQGCGGGGHSGGAPITSGGTPNLAITQVAVTTPTISQGQTVSFTHTISNSGTGPSNPLGYQLYISNQMITLQNYQGPGVLPVNTVNVIQPIDPGFVDQGQDSNTVSNTAGLAKGAGFAVIVVSATSNSPALISSNQSITIQ